MALVNKAARLGKLGRHQEAVATYNEVVTRFGESTDPGLLERVARAMVNKASNLATLNRTAQALEALDAVEQRFGKSLDPQIQQEVARRDGQQGAPPRCDESRQ